nr:TPA_asm: ND4 [Bombus superbus]
MMDMMVLIFLLFGFLIIYDFFNFLLLGNMIFLMMFFQLMKMNWVSWSFIMGNISLNYYSNGLMLLTYWIFGLILINLSNEEYINECIFLNMMLMNLMLFNFLSMSLLMFYFLFESSLLVIFYMIMKWGYSENRYLASFYLMFYTLLFSLPMLFLVFQILNLNGSYNFLVLEFNSLNMFSSFNFLYLIMSFLVKIPMFLFHGWLLKAHVEASYFSSMILASIMLKLGTYGMLRMIFMSKLFIMNFSIYLMVISMFGMLIMSILCLMQLDMKLIIAMSSVVHMSIMLFSMLTMTSMSMMGSYYLMISHGLVSSGLFYLVNVIYSQTNSRIIFINKGMINLMPSMSMFWFMASVYNSGAPISLNMVSEIFMLMGLIHWCKYLLIILMLYCLLSFIYSIYLFSFIQYGKCYMNMNVYNSKMSNYLILILHLIPLNLMIFNLLI